MWWKCLDPLLEFSEHQNLRHYILVSQSTIVRSPRSQCCTVKPVLECLFIISYFKSIVEEVE